MLSYRTLWVSDIHLGTRGCQAELLLDFLNHVKADTVYLVGDIFDGWVLKKRWYWPNAHNDVIQNFLKRARDGVKVVYIPGNHDELARDYVGLTFGGVEVLMKTMHVTADGKRLLI